MRHFKIHQETLLLKPFTLILSKTSGTKTLTYNLLLFPSSANQTGTTTKQLVTTDTFFRFPVMKNKPYKMGCNADHE
jgi:hypothetical protein